MALPLFSYPHAESNCNHRNRNPVFYPLNYGGNRVANILKKFIRANWIEHQLGRYLHLLIF